MSMSYRLLAGVVLAGTFAHGAAQAGPITALDALRTHDVIVFDNFRLGSDIKGSLYVDGNLNGSGMVGSGNGGYTGASGLTVTGNVTGQNLKVKNADVRVGGNVTGSIEIHDGGSAAIGGRNTGSVRLTGNTQGRSVQTGVADAAPALDRSDFAALSGDLAGRAAEARYGRADINDRNNFHINVADGNNDGIAVVNLDSGFLSSLSSFGLYGDGAALDTIIINVAGLDISLEANWQTGSLGSNRFASEHVIWNFFEAGTLNLSRQIFGTVLAPNAIVTNTSPIDGGVVAGGFTQRAQVNLPGYAGTRLTFADLSDTPTLVPEPAMIGLLGLGVLGVAALGRRSRNRAAR